MGCRTEHDLLGEEQILNEHYWGIHTLRALKNFPLGNGPVDRTLIRAYAQVKKAACLVNKDLGYIEPDKADAIMRACDEVAEGHLDDAVVVDALAGGAGTSLNMNINEVLANRALELAGRERGDYAYISPLDTVNLHQSTNDTFPTAVKVAALMYLVELEGVLTKLQQVFQEKEKTFRDIIKIGRTEMQPAVPMTLGAEFSGFAEAFAQDRWRVFKARERLRLVNLGGTAVGTGLAAPRDFIFMVTQKLQELTGLTVCRAENLVYPTQNADSFCEASGILKTCASNYVKVARDLRLLAMLGEISLGRYQAGSSIMPGKVNPVLCEAIIQAGLRVISNDGLLTTTTSLGTLQINEFMPLISFSLLESLRLLTHAGSIFIQCARDIAAREDTCRELVDTDPVIMTAFIPRLGYEKVTQLYQSYISSDQKPSVREFLEQELGKEVVDKTLSSENLTRLGFV